MRPTVWTIAFAILVAHSHGAHAQVISKTVPSGVKTKIDHYTGWNDDCSFKSLDIQVTTPPAHGEIASRIANGVIPSDAKIGSSGVCAGKPTKVLEVYYKSARGYKGPDSFTVDMSFGGSSAKDFSYSVDVR
jgi:hypothetical protein